MVDDANNGLDSLLNEAIGFVISKQLVSISYVQRQFRIGYNRAARMVEQMEVLGVISASDANGNRDVLAGIDTDPSDWTMNGYNKNAGNDGIASYEDNTDSLEIQMRQEAIVKKRIVIWLLDTGQVSEDGTKIHILKSYSPFRHLFDSQKRPAAIDNDPLGNVLDGYRFIATMQERTPLKVLLQHGRMEKRPLHKLPRIVNDDWQGCWVGETKTYRSLGVDINEVPEETMSSQIGQIPSNGGDYLRFLIFARNIKEAKASEEEKSNMRNLGKHMYGEEGTPFKELMCKYNFWSK